MIHTAPRHQCHWVLLPLYRPRSLYQPQFLLVWMYRNVKSSVVIPFTLITIRNSSCGKVMFSQVCVKNSVRGGWLCVAGGHAWQGACMVGGMHGRGACMAGKMATAADSTHPNGMHSCFCDVNSIVAGPSEWAQLSIGLGCERFGIRPLASLLPANEVCEGYVFTGVCLFTRGKGSLYPGGLCLGGSLSEGVSVRVSVWGLCPGGLCQGVPPMRLCAGGMHPTLMHSCYEK